MARREGDPCARARAHGADGRCAEERDPRPLICTPRAPEPSAGTAPRWRGWPAADGVGGGGGAAPPLCFPRRRARVHVQVGRGPEPKAMLKRVQLHPDRGPAPPPCGGFERQDAQDPKSPLATSIPTVVARLPVRVDHCYRRLTRPWCGQISQWVRWAAWRKPLPTSPRSTQMSASIKTPTTPRHR